MTLLEAVGHFAFALGAVSYWIRDAVWLRGLLIVSFLMAIVYNALPPVGPLWLVIFWLAVYAAINAFRIATIFRERRDDGLSEEERELHETMFGAFTLVQFRKLLRIGEWRDAAAGSLLAARGGRADEIIALYDGAVAVEVDGREIAAVRDGAVLGDMSFRSQGGAPATMRATAPTRYVVWRKTALRALLLRNPGMLPAVRSAFSRELTRTLEGEAGHCPLPDPPPRANGARGRA